jgi:MFS family permease
MIEATLHPKEAVPGKFRNPWVTLIGSTCCILLGPAVLGFYTLSLFMGPLGTVLGVGRGALSLSITVGTLATAISAPIMGRLIDRQGGRAVLLPAAVALSGVLAALAYGAAFLVGLYALFGVVGILCSVYYIAIPRIIASQFDRRRGLALGLTMSGTGLGAFAVIPFAQLLIERFGWRAAYLGLGMLVLCVSVPSAYFLVRPKPVLPPALADRSAARDPGDRRTSSLGMNFAVLVTTFFLIGIGLDGVVIHFVPILSSRHLSAADGAALFSAAGITIFTGRILCGLLMDRLPAYLVGSVVFLLSAIGILLLQLGTTSAALYTAAALFGLGVGAEMDVLGYLVSRLYALKDFARIYGLIYGAFMIGTSVGPPLFGHLYDLDGQYTRTVWLAAVVVALAATLMPFIRMPSATRSVSARAA